MNLVLPATDAPAALRGASPPHGRANDPARFVTASRLTL
jgi:hypothetical protein